MSPSEMQQILFGTLGALGASTLFLLAAFIGFCVVAGFTKLRRTSAGSMVNRSLEELVGKEHHARFLPPSAPRGTLDVLNTPELLESAPRKTY